MSDGTPLLSDLTFGEFDGRSEPIGLGAFELSDVGGCSERETPLAPATGKGPSETVTIGEKLAASNSSDSSPAQETMPLQFGHRPSTRASES